MPLSDARKRANKKWNDANLPIRYDRINLVIPKGGKAAIQSAANKEKETVNKYIGNAILNRMGVDEWPLDKGGEGDE